MFFSPHSSIWHHSIPEALIAEALAHSGFKIVYVGCRGALSARCTTFEAQGLSVETPKHQKATVCSSCVRAQNKIRKHFNLSKVDIDDYISADELQEFDDYLVQNDVDILTSCHLLGIPIGRYAAYETLIGFKKQSLYFEKIERQHYVSYLRGCFIVATAFERIFSEKKPDGLFIYNSRYSANHTVAELAKILNINVFALHAGRDIPNRLSTLILARDAVHLHGRRLLDIWPDYRGIPVSADLAQRITNYFFELRKGRSVFVYSTRAKSNFSIRQRYGLKAGQRLLLAVMSSADERFAAGFVNPEDQDAVRPQFASQVEWIKWLIEYVSGHESMFLVIRVHPRDFPNKRDRHTSDQALLLQKELQTLPNNVAINWPSDSLSLYDFCAEVDLVLNGWSSVGREFAMLGIPVVSYSADILTYPADINLTAETRTDYEAMIEKGLEVGWSLHTVRLAYRWLALELVYSVVDISDGFSPRVGRAQSILVRIFNKALALVQSSWQQDRICRKRPIPIAETKLIGDTVTTKQVSVACLRELPHGPEEVETEILINELRRLSIEMNLEKYDDSPIAEGIRRLVI